LVRQGNLPEALKSYRADLAIAERLSSSDSGNAEWQRDLSVSYNKIGDVLVSQGDLPEALKSYRASLAIRERLSSSDSGNAEWQRDLAVSYSKFGDLYTKQKKQKEALDYYHKALDIMERLEKLDPGNMQWREDIIEYNYDIAANGEDAPKRFAFVAAELGKLKTAHPLNAEQSGWLAKAQAALKRPAGKGKGKK
jgi:tetratricopeptide (TPR) repeat protein